MAGSRLTLSSSSPSSPSKRPTSAELAKQISNPSDDGLPMLGPFTTRHFFTGSHSMSSDRPPPLATYPLPMVNGDVAQPYRPTWHSRGSIPAWLRCVRGHLTGCDPSLQSRHPMVPVSLLERRQAAVAARDNATTQGGAAVACH